MGNLVKRGTIVLCLTAFLSVALTDALSSSAQIKQRAKPHASSPVRFEASTARSDSPVKYSARSACYSLFLSDGEADVVLNGENAPSGEVTRGKLIVVHAYVNLLRMRFVDSNPPTGVVPVGRETYSGASYTAIAYLGIYSGTDIIVHGDQKRIGFQLNLSPGSDSDHIVLEIAGATSIELDQNGDAIVHAGSESLALQRPTVRFGDGANSPVTGAYRIERGNRLRFVVGTSSLENSQTATD